VTGRPPRPAQQERGSTSLAFAMLSVVFLLLVLLVVQAALYYHARNVVKAEAEGVARAVRAYPTNARLQDSVPTAQQVRALAVAAAREQWDRLDDSGSATSQPRVDRAEVVGYDQVQITLSADPILILPQLFGGNRLTITATAGGPFEIFTRSGDD